MSLKARRCGGCLEVRENDFRAAGAAADGNADGDAVREKDRGRGGEEAVCQIAVAVHDAAAWPVVSGAEVHVCGAEGVEACDCCDAGAGRGGREGCGS